MNCVSRREGTGTFGKSRRELLDIYHFLAVDKLQILFMLEMRSVRGLVISSFLPKIKLASVGEIRL